MNPGSNEELQRVLFVDRDGTLIEEPPDEQVDSLEKIRFLPGVLAALQRLAAAGYRLVMVTNQDGLGTPSFPRERFDLAQDFVVRSFASQGLSFDAVCICPHRPADNCDCRKPKLGLVRDYLSSARIDLSQSVMIGDRLTDLEFARNLGVRGLRVQLAGAPEETWPAIASELLSRRAVFTRNTKETQIDIALDLDAEAPISIATGHGFFDHMLEQLARHSLIDITVKEGDRVIFSSYAGEEVSIGDDEYVLLRESDILAVF